MEDGCTGPLRACLVFLVFMIISGILSAFSTALKGVQDSEISKKAKEGDRVSARLEKMIDEPLRFINTSQALCVGLGLLAGWIGFRYFACLLADALASVLPVPVLLLKILSAVLVLWAVLVIVLSFAFTGPKKVASQHPEKTLYRYYGFVNFMVTVLKPVTVPVNALSDVVVRVLGMDPAKSREEVTEEEIISIVDDAHEQGVIKGNEAEMIQNIISFEDTDARDVMTHRKNIIALESTTVLRDAADFMLKGTNSRFPVYRGDIDNIIGIIHLKDAVKMLMAPENNDLFAIEDIPNLIREATIIPETRSIDSIFQLMQSKKMHMVIVVDEYGQTSGLITMEDILEEIVGSILDEYDDDDPFIQHQFDNSIVMDGLAPLDRVGEVLHYDFSGCENETLNGYLTKLLDHVPTAKDKTVIGKEFIFRILKVENHVIKKVRAERLPEEKGEQACQDIQNSRT